MFSSEIFKGNSIANRMAPKRKLQVKQKSKSKRIKLQDGAEDETESTKSDSSNDTTIDHDQNS